MELDEILSRLDGVKRSGERDHAARCPAHDDRTQSLTVGVGDDGRLLLKCHAGCSADDVCRAMGIQVSDLFAPKPNGNGKPKIVATYDYTSEAGELLYQVVRFEPKDFRQRRPDGNGGWEWKLGKTRRVLYRLPEVLAGVRSGEVVHVVEGEKDADALVDLGLTATTGAGGAGKWRSEYSDALTGARVTIVADRDEVGRKHAFAVAASLAGKAADISIVEAAEGKDASDHLDAGYTVREFVACRGGRDEDEVAGLPALTLADLLAQAPERPEYVWFGYIAKGSISELAAKPKVGKTRFIMEALSRIVSGEGFLDHATFPCRVLYLSEESRGTFVAGAKRAKVPTSDKVHVLLRGSVRSLKWDQIGELVLAYCEQHDIWLVIVDTLSDWAGIRGDDENSAGAAMAAMVPLRNLADSGRAVWAVRHEGHRKGDVGETARGSTAFGGSMDILMSLRRTRGKGHETRRELHAVGRFDETPPVLTIELDDAGYQVVSMSASSRAREVELQVLEELPMAEQWAVDEAELREKTSLEHSSVYKALKDLRAKGLVKSEKRPRQDGVGAVNVYWRIEDE